MGGVGLSMVLSTIERVEVKPNAHFSHQLTLSYPMWPLCGHLVLGIHISPNNGPIEMIPSGKLIYYVPPIHFACSIM